MFSEVLRLEDYCAQFFNSINLTSLTGEKYGSIVDLIQ